MKPKYYLIKLLTNTQGQDGSSVTVYTDSEDKSGKDKALVAYHQTLANFHNADDVLWACVKIEDIYGTEIASEIVDHVPQPEPEETTEE